MNQPVTDIGTNEKVKDIKGDLSLQLVQSREELEQAKYEFKRKIDSFEANEKHYADEIDYWKEENDKLKNQLKCLNNKFEEVSIRQKNAETEETFELIEKAHQVEAENVKLKKQLEDLQNRTIIDINDFEQVQELEVQVSDLKEKLQDLNVVSMCNEAKCNELEERNLALVKENQEYQKILDLTRNDLRQSNAIIMELQDEISVLRKEIFEIQNQPRDMNVKGNSLFAEVYDSRNRIKEKFLTLAAKYNRTLKEKDSLSEEVKILRSEAFALRDIFDKEMKNFKPGNMFELNGDSASMSAMRDLVQSYKEEIDKLTQQELPAEKDYRYYEAVIQRQRKEVDKLRGILSDHSMTHSMRARKISQLYYQMASWKSRTAELESEKRFMDLKLQELENKILDLQSELAKPEEKKDTEEKKDSENAGNKLIQSSLKKEQKPKKETITMPKVDRSQSLSECFSNKKMRIIPPEVIEAITQPQKKSYPTKESERKSCSVNENKENKSIENNDDKKTEEVQNEENPKSIDSNEYTRRKRTVQFREDAKKEDGENSRPGGKYKYVINTKTKEVRQIK